MKTARQKWPPVIPRGERWHAPRPGNDPRAVGFNTFHDLRVADRFPWARNASRCRTCERPNADGAAGRVVAIVHLHIDPCAGAGGNCAGVVAKQLKLDMRKWE